MSDEQLQLIIKAGNDLMESMRPFIELLERVWESIKITFQKFYEELKQFLYKKVPMKTKCYKKGKKYIHSYIKVKIWRMLV